MHSRTVQDMPFSFERLLAIGVEEQWLLPASEINILSEQVLGSGGFGMVMRGRYNGADVAIKAPKVSMEEHRSSSELSPLLFW